MLRGLKFFLEMNRIKFEKGGNMATKFILMAILVALVFMIFTLFTILLYARGAYRNTKYTHWAEVVDMYKKVWEMHWELLGKDEYEKRNRNRNERA